MNICPVCTEPVDEADAHFPHDYDCRNWGRSPIRGESDPYGCFCDRVGVHYECCSECQGEITRAAFMAKVTRPR